MHRSSGQRRPVSSVDVAAHAGVSQATVSRVLAGKDNVSSKTRQTVLASLEELGYQPNLSARALKTQRTSTIAVVVADITNPFYPELVEALSAALAERDQMMILWNDASTPEDDVALAGMMQGLVDGAVFATATEESLALRRARSLELPVVLVNRRLDQESFDSVTSDNENGGRLVAEYFRNHGRRPAVIAGPRTASTSRSRAAGFLDYWESTDPSPSPIIEYADFSHQSGVAFCEKMMNLDDPPDAIFATNDLTAFGVLDQARRMNVAVPQDLWVVGYDDIEMAGWKSLDLTTVAQPTAQMAESAVELLLERVDDLAKGIASVRFASELIIRGSTASARFAGRAE